MTDRRCKGCFYYEAKEKECRAKSPTPFPIPGVNQLTQQPQVTVAGLFPGTSEGNWCGEFKPAGIVTEASA